MGDHYQPHCLSAVFEESCNVSYTGPGDENSPDQYVRSKMLPRYIVVVAVAILTVGGVYDAVEFLRSRWTE